MLPFYQQYASPELATVYNQAIGDHSQAVMFFENMPAANYHPEKAGQRLSGLGRKEHPCWTCHALVRALQRLSGTLGLQLQWQVRDGAFIHKAFNHSWLEATVDYGDEQKVHFILDLYPVAGVMGPELRECAGPWASAYLPKDYDPQDHATFDEESFAALEAFMYESQYLQEIFPALHPQANSRH